MDNGTVQWVDAAGSKATLALYSGWVEKHPQAFKFRDHPGWVYRYPPELQKHKWKAVYPHHMAHAAGGFYDSPFDRALVLVMDGGGDDKSTIKVLSGNRSAVPHLQVLDEGFINMGVMFHHMARLGMTRLQGRQKRKNLLWL
uniref:Carbamoyltransferase domain-containing protein n=1 Tax=Eutreptiella gymnastica TaxID=73025 RepID=A0A7S1HTA8_9EUGL